LYRLEHKPGAAYQRCAEPDDPRQGLTYLVSPGHNVFAKELVKPPQRLSYILEGLVDILEEIMTDPLQTGHRCLPEFQEFGCDAPYGFQPLGHVRELYLFRVRAQFLELPEQPGVGSDFVHAPAHDVERGLCRERFIAGHPHFRCKLVELFVCPGNLLDEFAKRKPRAGCHCHHGCASEEHLLPERASEPGGVAPCLVQRLIHLPRHIVLQTKPDEVFF
jgi:hypothetical protein